MLQKEFEEQANLRKFSAFSAIPPSEKKCIKYHVDCALNSAEISLHCNAKNVRQQFWLD